MIYFITVYLNCLMTVALLILIMNSQKCLTILIWMMRRTIYRVLILILTTAFTMYSVFLFKRIATITMRIPSIIPFKMLTCTVINHILFIRPGPLLTKRTDVLPLDLAKSRSREIRAWSFPTALKFDGHLGSTATEMPVKFQSARSL